MVSVMISGQSEYQQKDDFMPSFSLRNAVSWYPDVPGPSLKFHDTTGRFYGLNLDLPVCFTIFAPSVDKLADVRGIEVHTREAHFGHGGDTLWSIVPRPSSLPIEGVLLLNAEIGEMQKHYFEIDGKGGERITAMETSYADGSVEGFKVWTPISLLALSWRSNVHADPCGQIQTNHGRKFQFPQDYDNVTSIRLRTTRFDCVAHEKAVVGFWGILVRCLLDLFQSLGVANGFTVTGC